MPAPVLILALALVSDPDTTLHLRRNGAVTIETYASDVVVRTGSTDAVTVHGASATMDGGTLSISDGPRRSRAGGPVEVTVPSWARVEISSVGGNLTITNAPDRLTAETVNGFIHLSGGAGTVELSTVAGNVAITDFRGKSLSVGATGGTVAINGASGEISVDNVNSAMVLHGIRSTSVSASSINGAIEFEGALAPTGSYDFSSQNDNVTFILPGDVSARMEITTMNGQLRSPQIPATTTGTAEEARNRGGTRGKHKDNGDGERTFTAVFGGGAAHLSVDVFNGDVVVKKKP